MPGITLSGVDEGTPFSDLTHLAELGAEIVFLYTFDPEDRHRYPPEVWIENALRLLWKNHTALHVCGTRARKELLDGNLEQMAHGVNRIQVNGQVSTSELLRLCNLMPYIPVITQHTEANADLLSVGAKNHALLVDSSGGRGLLPTCWERPETAKAVGFAGGLTPDNLAEELPKIAAVAKGEWWLDMETSLRDENDWFSVPKALKVMEIWRKCHAGEVAGRTECPG